MSCQNFTIRDQEKWDAYVAKSLYTEAFYSWVYHQLNEEGEPLLFVHQCADFFIALPVIKRPIDNSPFYDMTSVYGYSGPFSDADLIELSPSAIADFKNAFMQFMHEEKAVCIFTRLNPFGGQERVLDGIGGVKTNGATVYVDLTTSLEEQHKGYDKRLFRQIKKLRKSNYEIVERTDEKSIDAFLDMYYKNMDRVHASGRYYFDQNYISGLLNIKGFNNKLMLIYKDGELICGSIILISKYIIRNHLSATAANYLKESPCKLLNDEICLMGREMGKTIFHLGGGVGGKKDSLFEFKRRFSDLQIDDHIWCFINDELNYNKLVENAALNAESDSSYFPLYRMVKLDTPVSA